MRLLVITLLILLLPVLAGAANIPLPPEERAWLDDHAHDLTLSFEPRFPPIEYLSADGQFSGLSADLLTAIEKRLHITLTKRPVQHWTEVLDGLRSGTTAIAPAITPTEERKEYVIFTKPYAEIPLVIMTRRGEPTNLTLDSLDNRIVDVVRGYASADIVRSHANGRFQVREVDNIREGLHDVSFGLADALVESQAVAAWYISKEGITNLQIAGTTGVVEPLTIGISNRYPHLAHAVQKAIDSIPPDEMQRIVNRWIKLDVPLFDAGTLLAIKIAVGLTCAVVCILTLLAWMLRRRLKEKMHSLEQTQDELKENLARFQMTLEVTRAGFWEYYPEEDREENSPEWYTMLGYSAQYGSRTLNVWIDLLHPDDCDEALSLFRAYLARGGHGLYEREFRMRKADGSWCWVLGKGRTVEWDRHGKPTKVLGINLDIQQMKKSQEEADKSRALSRALLEQTTQFIGLIDPQGRLLATNRSSLEWINAREEDVLGKPFWETAWWTKQEAAKKTLLGIIEQAMEGRSISIEVEHEDQQGQPAVFDFTASPFRNDSGIIESIIVEARNITSRKAREHAITESEQRFRSIFENAPYTCSIFRLSDGRYQDVNNLFLERTGYTREEILELRPTDIGTLPPEHQQMLQETFAAGRSIQNLQTRITRPDGTVRHLLYSGSAIQLAGEACVLSMTVDLTDLRQAQDALLRSEEKFARLFHLSPDMTALARQRDGRLLEVNEAFCRFTGIPRDQAVGRTSLELGIFVNPDRRHDFVTRLKNDQVTENFEFDLRHMDGHILHCSASARLLDLDGEPCILTMARDVTQLRRMEEMLVQTEKMHSLGGIAAGIAHEINNPLGIILQGVQTVTLRLQSDFPKNLDVATENGLDMPSMKRYMEARKIPVFLADIENAALRASKIIRHMLDFSRRSESRTVQCSLPELVDKAISLASNDFDLKKNYDFRSIEIVREFDDDLEPISCTETDLEQVFLNLLKNAAQAMAESNPPTKAPRIRIAAHRIGDSMHIEFQDNGPGIPRELRTRIFEPFFTTKGTGVGTGLGLSVSYFIITTGHGGTMRVTSPPEGGTVFVIDLPFLHNKRPHGWTGRENQHTDFK